ncbi:MAG: hypothetical protein ACREJB_16445, partial [Planctomycetaceae bacterium]
MDRLPGPARFLCCALLSLAAIAPVGCAACRPLDGIPPECVSDDLRGPSRSGRATIDLSLLRRSRPAHYLVDSGDVLAVYIEGVIGNRTELPPVHFPEHREAAPSWG